MARISKYQFDQNITKEDFVIGSDGITKRTRNYKIEDLTKFLGVQQEILGDKFAYTYIRTSDFDQIPGGKLTFNNYTQAQTLFSDITSVYLNRYNAFGDDVYNYLVETEDSDGVLNIHNGNATTNFGAFSISAVNLIGNNVIKLDVNVLANNGFITDVDPAVISVVFSNPDKTYVHSQLSSQDTWNVTHSLNKFPSVSVVDDGNNLIIGDIQYINKDQLTITFGAPISGKAYIN